MELITLTLGPGDKLALGLGETNLQARVLEKTDFQTFNTWLGTYQKLLENSQNRDALLALGRELVAWLDQILDGHFPTPFPSVPGPRFFWNCG